MEKRNEVLFANESILAPRRSLRNAHACRGRYTVGIANQCTTACPHAPGMMCSATGDGCCPVSCSNAPDADGPSTISVGIINCGFYTDHSRAYLASQDAHVNGGTHINDACTQGGGGIVAMPWLFNNNGGLPSLSVTGVMVTSRPTNAFNEAVSNANHPLLQGVRFVERDAVGWEEWTFSLQNGATSAAYWVKKPWKQTLALNAVR